MNIMPLVMQYFGPVIMNKIAGSLGINSTLAQKAIAYAAPAILAGIVGKVSQPGGAKVLSDMIAKQDPSLMGKLNEMIGTGRQASVVEQGTSSLGALLGNSTLGSLAGALSKQAGVGVGASNTLLGLMGPAILGTLGREQKSGGLDAAGLGNALISQKQQIADAIPADFAKLLAGTGLLDAVQGKSADVNAKPQPMPRATTAAASTTATPASTRPDTRATPAAPVAHHHHHHAFNWWPWLLAIAAACGIWWSVFGERVTQPQQTTAIPSVVAPPKATATTSAALPPALATSDIGKQIGSALDDMRGSLSSIRDQATAQTALPRLQDIAGRFDRVSTQAASLNPEQRRAVSTWVGSQQSVFKNLIGSVMALPGVAGVLKTVLDQIQGRIDGLAKV